MRRGRFLLTWVLTMSACLCALTLFLAGLKRYYVWSWVAYTIPPVQEFGPDNLAPDFTLRDLDGQPFHLAEEVVRSPLVLQIGSFS